eukprot:CAMPEP_0180504576 /NCGR_PEP_ID=MMETSP1036_2-20121128/46813_1 /TAXON_ID=632150 /ORGANISM="Azadinium spinosum, Strain 3D9" /LENGTH=42 /DNA_ID= /DNA_START= /DNA_END= /DNA_ORIENTATION=
MRYNGHVPLQSGAWQLALYGPLDADMASIMPSSIWHQMQCTG